MTIAINLTPQDIENYVKEALIKSSIGKAIQTAVDSVLNKSYDNPIDKEIKAMVGRIAYELLHEKYKDQVKQLVQAQIEKVVTDQMLQTVTDKAVEKMEQLMYSDY